MELLERLHSQVWSRFIRMPQGHLLDYADEAGNVSLPTAEECQRAMPNALGWWTPIENGAFFAGLYAYALIAKYKKYPDEKTGEEIRILMGGLKQLQDVVSVDGFIARGVADDNVSHYPFSSEDQVVPWVLALYAYLNCDLCEDPQQIRERLHKTLRAIKDYGWRIPTEIDDLIMGSWETSISWRAAAKLLYCARILYEITGEEEDLRHYEALRDTAPAGWYFTRKELVSHGFSHDMIHNKGLMQSWIFVASHLGLTELTRLDPENAQYFGQAVLLDGVTAIRMIDNMKEYDNASDGFDMNWRRLEPFWKPVGDNTRDAVNNALAMAGFWGKEVVPHRSMEHKVLGFSLFSAWIAVTCGDDRIASLAKQKLEEYAKAIHWEGLHLCYAFAAEAALIS